MTADELEAKIEKMVMNFRGCGRPTTRENWRAVVTMLLPCSDEALDEFARQGRMLGVEWITRVAEALRAELSAGRAFRDRDGAIRLREAPKEETLRNALGL